MAVYQPTQSMPESWKPVVGYEGLYDVSSRGRVRSLDREVKYSNGSTHLHRGRVLKFTPMHGYSTVCLAKNGTRKTSYVHLLVLEAFVGPRPPKMEGCHRDDVQTNNNLSNLRWDTPSENRRDIIRNGNNYELKKTHCPQGHELSLPNLNPSDIKRGKRVCRSCKIARSWAHRLKDKTLDEIKEKADAYYNQIMQP